MGSEDFVRMVSYFSVLAIMASWELLAVPSINSPAGVKYSEFFRWGPGILTSHDDSTEYGPRKQACLFR